MRKLKSKKRVICAMSGGIDSSVAAALLKRAGFDVIGVFMKFWTDPLQDGLHGRWNKCCSPEAEKRAREVASCLSIPFYVYRFEREFKKRIVDYFLKEYKEGGTPNPCVVCNKEIKFGLLMEKALKLEADYVATGHYARLQKTRDRKIRLLRGKDKNKDQSYFLWQLNQKQLKHILFPVGNYTKTEAKRLVKKFKLPVSGVPESQEVCFIQTTVSNFLKKYLKPKPGKIIDTEGKIISQHQGLHFYTIGQRKGIKLPGGPYYVLDKDLNKNLLIVTKNEKDLYKKELKAEKINWISGEQPKLPLKIKAKIRYKHKVSSVTIEDKSKSKSCKLIFNKPQRAITPGQSVVFYRGQEVLGGGVIKT